MDRVAGQEGRPPPAWREQAARVSVDDGMDGSRSSWRALYLAEYGLGAEAWRFRRHGRRIRGRSQQRAAHRRQRRGRRLRRRTTGRVGRVCMNPQFFEIVLLVALPTASSRPGRRATALSVHAICSVLSLLEQRQTRLHPAPKILRMVRGPVAKAEIRGESAAVYSPMAGKVVVLDGGLSARPGWTGGTSGSLAYLAMCHLKKKVPEPVEISHGILSDENWTAHRDSTRRRSCTRDKLSWMERLAPLLLPPRGH